MARMSWTDELILEILALRGESKGWADIAAEMGYTEDQVRCAVRRWQSRAGADPVDDSPSVPLETTLDIWRAQEDKPGWREIIDHALTGADLHQRMRPSRTEATRTIHTKEPIFLVHLADLHLGSPTTDYRAFLETTDLIMSDKRFFLVVVGADVENAMVQFKSAEAVLNQVMPPWMQLEAYKQWLEEMLPRTVAICGDNHVNERMERIVGDLLIEQPKGVPLFPAFGILDLELDNGEGDPVTYKAVLSHKYKGSSIYHDLQPTLRMMREIHPLADWYCTAHKHVPAYMRGVFFERARIGDPYQHFIVCGTFNTMGNLYALRNFGGSGVLGLPTLALWPDKHQIEVFSGPGAVQDLLGKHL